jgi:hypothetical protein
MDKEEKDRLLAKLQKLLALTASPNENEAKLASVKAAELMAKYSLDMEDIEIIKNGSGKSKLKDGQIVREDIKGIGPEKEPWESRLANQIANSFDCKIIIRPLQDEWYMAYIGMKADIEVAKWYHTYLRRSIGRTAKERHPRVREKKARKDFAMGATLRVCERLKEMLDMRNEAARASGSTDIILYKKEAVEEYIKSAFQNLRPGRKQSINHTPAFRQGVLFGNNLNLPTGAMGTNSKPNPQIRS